MRVHFNVSLKENLIFFYPRIKKRSNFLVTLIEYRKRKNQKNNSITQSIITIYCDQVSA